MTLNASDVQFADLMRFVRQIADDLRALRVAKLGPIKKLAEKDQKDLTKLLPVIYGAVSTRPFSVKMLTEHAKLGIAPALLLRDALRQINTRKLGRLFKRGCEFQISGYHIENLGRGRDGRLWRVICDEVLSPKVAKTEQLRVVRF